MSAISNRQMYRVMDQMLNGVEVTEEGPGVEEFKQAFAKDLEKAKANGWIIDIPFDLALGDNCSDPPPPKEDPDSLR